MKIEEFPIASLDGGSWDSFLDKAGAPGPFCRYNWLSLVAGAFPQWNVGFIVATEENRIVAGLPFVDSRNWFRQESHALPWGTPGGVILSPDTESSVADSLIESWLDSRADFGPLKRFSITFPGSDPLVMDVLQERKFRLISEISYVIELTGGTFEQWEASLSDSVRNQNRQAQRRGASFDSNVSIDCAGEIYDLASCTARRHGRGGPVLNEDFYRALLKHQEEDSPARVFMVRVNDLPAVFSVCLVHNNKLWLWDYGADERTFESRPNNLMYRSIVEWAFGKGLERIDLGAVPPGASSLAAFKASFGGRPQERLSAVKETTLFRIATGVNSFIKRCR